MNGFFVIPSLLHGLDCRDRTVPGNWYFCPESDCVVWNIRCHFPPVSVFFCSSAGSLLPFLWKRRPPLARMNCIRAMRCSWIRIYISAFILLLAAISYLIIRVDKWQSPIPLVTEPGLSYSVSGFNSGYMKAGNRPLLRSVESWQENQSFQACRFLSLHCRHPTL